MTTDVSDDVIVDEYVAGESLNHLVKKYRKSNKVIRQLITSRGVVIRSRTDGLSLKLTDKNRTDAKSKGLKTYHGSMCKECGANIKYVSTYGCVPCTRKNDKRNELSKADPEKRRERSKKYQKKATEWKRKNGHRYRDKKKTGTC